MAKVFRYEMHWNEETYVLAERAARAAGLNSIEAYVTLLVKQNAPKVLEAYSSTRLTNAQFVAFCRACDNPPAPTEKLRKVDVRSFDCGKDAINTYLRRYAARNMTLNLNRTFVLPYTTGKGSGKSRVAAYYTLAHQTLVRKEVPDPARLPRYPVPVILLAQPGIDRRFQGQGLGAKTLVQALRHAYRIAVDPDGLPAMGVVLDVLDQDAKGFYQSFEFFLPLTDDPMKLFVPMASLETL